MKKIIYSLLFSIAGHSVAAQELKPDLEKLMERDGLNRKQGKPFGKNLPSALEFRVPRQVVPSVNGNMPAIVPDLSRVVPIPNALPYYFPFAAPIPNPLFPGIRKKEDIE